jgi:hypothetical protein
MVGDVAVVATLDISLTHQVNSSVFGCLPIYGRIDRIAVDDVWGILISSYERLRLVLFATLEMTPDINY